MGETLTKAAASERFLLGGGRLQSLAQSGRLDVEYVQDGPKRTMLVDADDVAAVKKEVEAIDALKERRQKRHALLTRLRAKRHRETIIELLRQGLADGLSVDLLGLATKHLTDAPPSVVAAWQAAAVATGRAQTPEDENA